MAKIKSVSMAIIAKHKVENPDFDLDFDALVKDITADETQLTKAFEALIKDSYKRTKRLSRSSSQSPVNPSPAGGEARFARLIQQHQQSRLLAHRQGIENEERRLRAAAAVEHDGGRNAIGDEEIRLAHPEYIAASSRNQMDLSFLERYRRPADLYEAREDPVAALARMTAREEDKEDEGGVELNDAAGTVDRE